MDHMQLENKLVGAFAVIKKKKDQQQQQKQQKCITRSFFWVFFDQ